MPILNETKNQTIECTLYTADSWLTRLIGWLDTSEPLEGAALHIVPCSSIHSFGMKYPIDVAFIDENGYTIHILKEFAPNRVSKIIRSAAGAIEFPSESAQKLHIDIGDQLALQPDTQKTIDYGGLRRLFHRPANILLAAFWSMFVFNSFKNWSDRGELLSLGLLIVNTIIFFLFLTRKESKALSQSPLDWFIAMTVVGLSFLLKPFSQISNLMASVSLIIQGIGILFILNSLISLGRSFGVVPARRSIQTNGSYKWIRHPLYGSELIFYIGFLSGNFSPYNLFLFCGILAGQIYRMYAEEKLLSEDSRYVSYMRKVKYRLIPGIF